jgi:N-acetylglucosamine-6-phosphate deacetylase
VTHLVDAQTPLGRRGPGVPRHALVDERLTLGVIADLHHLDADVLRLVFRPRVALVTDAIAAAGMPPGACA